MGIDRAVQGRYFGDGIRRSCGRVVFVVIVNLRTTRLTLAVVSHSCDRACLDRKIVALAVIDKL